MDEKKTLAWKWGLSLLLGISAYLLCPEYPEAPMARMYMGITVWGVTAFAVEAMELEILSVIICALYILTGVGRPDKIMSPWTFSTIWLVFGGLLVGHMTMSTGLARRIALAACARLGGSYAAVLAGLLVGGIILGPVITSALGKCVVISAVAIGCCQALKLEPMSRSASGILLAGFIGVDAGRLGPMTGGADTLMIMDVYSRVLGYTKPAWIDYLLHNFFPSVLYGAVAMIFVYFLCRPKESVGAEALKEQLETLPKFSLEEKKGSILLLVLILSFVTEKIHGLNIAYVAVLLASSMFLPGIRLLSRADMPKINVWMLIFIACSMSLGMAAKESGVDKIMASVLTPYLAGTPSIAAFKFYLTGVVGNFLLTPLASIAALTVPLGELAGSFGNPLPYMYAFNHGSIQVVFPYESALLLYFYATGYVKLRTLLFVQGVRLIFNTVLFGLIVIPFWHFIGIFS